MLMVIILFLYLDYKFKTKKQMRTYYKLLGCKLGIDFMMFKKMAIVNYSIVFLPNSFDSHADDNLYDCVCISKIPVDKSFEKQN